MADVAEKVKQEVNIPLEADEPAAKKLKIDVSNEEKVKLDGKIETPVNEKEEKKVVASVKEGDAKLESSAKNDVEGAEDDDLNTEQKSEKDENLSKYSKQEAQIIRQVEYYFGDANLLRDKFLLEQINKEEGGWVPLTLLLTFKRLAAITTNVDAIVDALHKSDEGLIEISEDKQKVRRHPERPIPEHNEERRKDIMSRTVYVKGFPIDIDMSAIIDFFMPYTKISNICMRKYHDKATKIYKFKGSVFVTFADKEHAAEFIKKEKVQFEERELIRKWQETYLEEKKGERNSKKKSKPVEEDKFSLPKGTVLRFEDASEKVTRELIREAVEKVDGEWEVAFIEYSKGDKAGYIRLLTENSAAKLLEKLEENKLKLVAENEAIEITLRTLDEDEEKAVLQKAIEHIKSRRSQSNRHKGGHHHYGGRKRHSGGGSNGGEKKIKSEC